MRRAAYFFVPGIDLHPLHAECSKYPPVLLQGLRRHSSICLYVLDIRPLRKLGGFFVSIVIEKK